MQIHRHKRHALLLGLAAMLSLTLSSGDPASPERDDAAVARVKQAHRIAIPDTSRSFTAMLSAARH
jgi:hypothetical protein